MITDGFGGNVTINDKLIACAQEISSRIEFGIDMTTLIWDKDTKWEYPSPNNREHIFWWNM